jgi:hypothetical protein
MFTAQKASNYWAVFSSGSVRQLKTLTECVFYWHLKETA